MQKQILIGAGILLAVMSGRAPATAVEWEAAVPASMAHHGQPEFYQAIEAGNGDFLLAGADTTAAYMVRLKPDGKVRWAGRAPLPGSHTRNLGVFETSLGVVTLWGCCSNPGWSAIRYDDTGGVAARVELEYPRGLHDVTPGGRVVLLFSGPGTMQTWTISAEGRSLSGGGDWKASMAMARMDEVIGIRSMGESSIAALDRMGGASGDTLKLWKFDGSGAPLWTRDLPTGRKGSASLQNHSIEWKHLVHDSGSRIVLAGVAASLPADLPPPDSLALAVLSSDGTPLWVKRFPILKPGEPRIPAFWRVDLLLARAEGIRAHLFHEGAQRRWKTLDFTWSGEPIGEAMESPEIKQGNGVWWALPMAAGTYLGIGSVLGPGSMLSPDSIWRPTSYSTPVIYGSIPGGIGEWRDQSLLDYADTIWSRSLPTPWGRDYFQTPSAGLNFLLPTRDGGAISGGRLWRRNGRDTVAIVAVKIRAEPVGTLRRGIAGIRPRGNQKRGAIRFDAAGRSRRDTRGPGFQPKPSRR